MIIMQISRCMHFNRLSPIAFWELLRGKKALSLHQSTTKGRHATNGHRKWNYYSTTKGQHSSTLVVAVAPPLLKPLWRNSPPRGQGRETWTSGLSHVYHSPHLMQAGVLVKREKQLSVKCLLSWSLPDTSNNKHLLERHSALVQVILSYHCNFCICKYVVVVIPDPPVGILHAAHSQFQTHTSQGLTAETQMADSDRLYMLVHNDLVVCW